MKELKMFPQITEETEENLLNLEEGHDSLKSPLSSTPPQEPSSFSSSESPTEAPSSPNYENQVPCPLPTITTEDVDLTSNSTTASPPPEDEFDTPPPRVRMRSLSGGAYRLAPTLPTQGRTRRQSGDDVLSPSRRAVLFEHFRPRSKSDSKGKRPTFLTSLKNSLFSGGAQRKKSLEGGEYLEPLQPTGDNKSGTMSKMIDLFRNRSNSLSIEYRHRKQSTTTVLPVNSLLRRHSVDPDKRRRPVNVYRTLEGHSGEQYPPHVEDEAGDGRIDYGALDDDKIIPTFLSSHSCYNAMPKSGKVILLSTDLLVKNAFSSLVINEVRSAPLWDSTAESFIGILTITDFINVLRHYHYSSQEDIHAIENQQIQTWRRITNVDKPFIKIDPSNSLANAAKIMSQEGVHRLPVFEGKKNTVLFVLTRKRLLQYLYTNLIENFEKTNVRTPNFMKKTIGELRIGTYENIATVTPDTKVIEALDTFVERNVSALPVLENCRLTNIFAKFDVFALAKEQTYHNLSMTISEVLEKATVHEDTFTCSPDEPLESVIYRFVTFKAHRLVVIDKKDSVVGMISLSDVLKFLVVDPLALIGDSVVGANDTIEEEGAVGGVESESSVTSGSEVETNVELQKSLNFSKLEPSDLSDDLIKLQIGTESDAFEALLDSSLVEQVDTLEEPDSRD